MLALLAHVFQDSGPQRKKEPQMRSDGVTGTVCTLLLFLVVLPETGYGLLRHLGSMEACSEKVEDCEFIFC